jgi:hypothetical protein
MQGEGVAAILAVPIWVGGTAAAVFVVAILLAVKRAGGSALITSLFRVGLIAAAVVGAWLYVQQPNGERRALDDRNAVLLAGSIAPGSTLSCLDELAGEVVEAACEKAVFATPEAVAAGVRYVTAQLALLNDGTAYAQRGNASYAAELTLLRTSIELDRFGLVAHVLSEREGCTADRCEALTRLSDATRVLGNLRDRTFEERVNRYSAFWNAPRPTEVVVASVNLASPGVNGPGTGVTQLRGSAIAEPASQITTEPPVATLSVTPLPQELPPVRDSAATPASVAPSLQEPPALRDPAAAEPVQSAAETPTSVPPLPPHRPPQVRVMAPVESHPSGRARSLTATPAIRDSVRFSRMAIAKPPYRNDSSGG